ncbi:MAG: thiamine pyrophosphate-binding protein [Smithella sp.]|jgi:acetolactate synthase-1/2/3 large subunit
MKIKVADYIANLLSVHGITNVFSVVGGGAMHLNNAFGQHRKLKCIYNHHEQASAIAAESFAKIENKLAVACVTTGPGGTNAITGVLCAYLDNIPLLVISGQVRYATTVESSGLNLRQFGEQEYKIVESIKPMTKYAVMVKNPQDIKYHIERAIFEATTGRKGPCWIDIPLDVQASIIEDSDLISFKPEKKSSYNEKNSKKILDRINKAERPVIIAGSAIRQAGCLDEFYTLVGKLNIPVVCPTAISDYFHYDHPSYFGNFGVFGGRAGNFIVQNADLIISFGARMSFKQTGFNYKTFAPNAEKIIVDIDIEELKKDTIKIDFPIQADVSDVIRSLNKIIVNKISRKAGWLQYCTMLKKSFGRLQKRQTTSKAVNPYFFASRLQEKLSKDAIIILGNSCACASISQYGISKKGQRLYTNVNCGTMGYDIPAAIGAAAASGKPVICITGDGSFQMNIQELQTVVHNKLPIKFIIFNNNGYQAILNTQTNFFNGVLSGCTPYSGISFPSFKQISRAYNIPFRKIKNHGDIDDGIDWLLSLDSYGLCEVIQDNSQAIEPRVVSKKLADGTMVSPPIDDLAPFLSQKEYEKYSKFKK